MPSLCDHFLVLFHHWLSWAEGSPPTPAPCSAPESPGLARPKRGKGPLGRGTVRTGARAGLEGAREETGAGRRGSARAPLSPGGTEGPDLSPKGEGRPGRPGPPPRRAPARIHTACAQRPMSATRARPGPWGDEARVRGDPRNVKGQTTWRTPGHQELRSGCMRLGGHAPRVWVLPNTHTQPFLGVISGSPAQRGAW